MQEDWYDEDTDESETDACPHCGYEIYEDAERCPECGLYVSELEDSGPDKPTWVVVTAFILVAMILYWFIGPLL